MKTLLLVAGAFFASAAFARQIVIPTLPVSPFAKMAAFPVRVAKQD